ncbi:MAG: BRO-N domain-containing protein [Fusobacteriaceae bacterium]
MNLKGEKFENCRLGMKMFIGREIAEMLGYSNPSTATSENVDKEYKTTLYVRSIENTGNSVKTNSEINNNIALIVELGSVNKTNLTLF